MVYLERAENLSFDQERIADAQILKGNVVFRHDDALMYCDSAYFYENTNSLDAFGHVRLVQGDTLEGFGDKLFYNGNTKLARLRRRVKLVHGRVNENPTILTTDSLNYDRAAGIAYYFTGGTVEDSLNTLTSVRGNYRPGTKQAVFSKNVKLVNPNFAPRRSFEACIRCLPISPSSTSPSGTTRSSLPRAVVTPSGRPDPHGRT